MQGLSVFPYHTLRTLPADRGLNDTFRIALTLVEPYNEKPMHTERTPPNVDDAWLYHYSLPRPASSLRICCAKIIDSFKGTMCPAPETPDRQFPAGARASAWGAGNRKHCNSRAAGAHNEETGIRGTEEKHPALTSNFASAFGAEEWAQTSRI